MSLGLTAPARPEVRCQTPNWLAGCTVTRRAGGSAMCTGWLTAVTFPVACTVSPKTEDSGISIHGLPVWPVSAEKAPDLS
jgi:hypothetical protein